MIAECKSDPITVLVSLRRTVNKVHLTGVFVAMVVNLTYTNIGGRLATSQSKRAAFIIEKFKQAEDAGKDLHRCRAEVITATETEFNSSCHGCLLLAVLGLYKNGYIEGTAKMKTKVRDMTGFDGNESLDIRHAFDALELLKQQPQLNPTAIKSKLGGDHSIYAFVVHYFKNGLVRSD